MRQLKGFEELIGFDRREEKPNGRRAIEGLKKESQKLWKH
jgi:hypothetical protein